MAKLTLKDVGKIYDNKVIAVKDFNMDIQDKEFIVLVGPSGCGKTTMLRMIAGLEEITSGEIFIGDTLVNALPPRERDIAMVFQNYALYPHMTVFDNMGFALKMSKVPKAEIRERVVAAAELLEITEYLKRKPKQLSGGQRQRVAIGRCIVRNPKVFLMDEPLSNLDAKLRNQMRAELVKLHKRINTTFIYVTHDQVEAMTLGTRIVVMKDSCIQQIGRPEQVYRAPANIFVAGFIGSPQMNFMKNVPLVKEQGEYVVKIMGISHRLNDSLQIVLKEKNYPESEVVAGIRPEHIFRSQEKSISAKIEVVEKMGSVLHLYAVADEKPLLITLNNLRGSEYDMGDSINCEFDANEIQVFDPETEKSLLYLE